MSQPTTSALIHNISIGDKSQEHGKSAVMLLRYFCSGLYVAACVAPAAERINKKNMIYPGHTSEYSEI